MRKKTKSRSKTKISYDDFEVEIVPTPTPLPVYDLRMELLVKALLSIDEILFREDNEEEKKVSEAA